MKKTRMPAMLLMVALFFLMVGGMAEGVPAPEHKLLTLGDAQVVYDGNVVNADGEGWHYDPATATLTLDGAVITGYKTDETGASGLYCDGDLNIVLNGENVMDYSGKEVEGSFSGACVLGSLNVSGPGKLSIKCGNAAQDSIGLYGVKNLTLSGGSVDIVSGSAMRSFGMASRDQIQIEGGAVVNTAGGNGKVLSAGLYSGQGNIWISDSSVCAAGGNVVSGEADQAQSSGIWAHGMIEINASAVKAVGGAASATEGQEAHGISNGLYAALGMNVDLGSKLEIIGEAFAGGN